MAHDAYAISVRYRTLAKGGGNDFDEIIDPLCSIITDDTFMNIESKERWSVLLTCEKILANSIEQHLSGKSCGANKLIDAVLFQSVLGEPSTMNFGFRKEKIGFTGVVPCSVEEAEHWSKVSGSLAFIVWLTAIACFSYSYNLRVLCTGGIASTLNKWYAFFGNGVVLLDGLRESDDRFYLALLGLHYIRVFDIELPLTMIPENLFILEVMVQGFDSSIILQAVTCVSSMALYRLFTNLSQTNPNDIFSYFNQCLRDIRSSEPRRIFSTSRVVDDTLGPTYLISGYTYGVERVKGFEFNVEQNVVTENPFVVIEEFYAFIGNLIDNNELPNPLRRVFRTVLAMKHDVIWAT